MGLVRNNFFPHNIIICSCFSFRLQKLLVHCMSLYSQFMANKASLVVAVSAIITNS